MAQTFTPPSPVRSQEDAAYFDAAQQGRLLLKKCDGCGEVFFYPRLLCPHCLSESTWVEASGQGTIYSYSRVATRDGGYTIAMVTLAEGPTMMTNILAADPMKVAIGQKVQVQFVESDGDEKVAMFVPVDG